MLKKLLFVVVSLIASIGMALAAVNINTATEAELDSLPGVGPAKAKGIVEYRKANGNFKSLEDIKNVKGIGDKTFEDLKSQISLSGATTPVAAPAKAAKEDKKAEKKEAVKEEPKAAKSEKPAKAEKAEKVEKPAKADKADKAEKSSSSSSSKKSKKDKKAEADDAKAKK